MKSFQYYFSIIFWSLFLIVTLIEFYSQGKKVLDNSIKIKGKVVDMIPVWKMVTKTKGRYFEMPQIEYFVGDSSYLFVDHNTHLNIGAEPTLIYEKGNIRNIKVYTIKNWIDIAFLIPALLISSLIYCIVIILSGRDDNKPHILPSNV